MRFVFYFRGLSRRWGAERGKQSQISIAEKKCVLVSEREGLRLPAVCRRCSGYAASRLRCGRQDMSFEARQGGWLHEAHFGTAPVQNESDAVGAYSAPMPSKSGWGAMCTGVAGMPCQLRPGKAEQRGGPCQDRIRLYQDSESKLLPACWPRVRTPSIF